MSTSVNAKLYKIQNAIYQDFENIEAFIISIVEQYNDKTGHNFESIALNADLDKIVIAEEGNNYSYNAKLFALNTEYKTPDWINFAESISPETVKLESFKNRYSSFLLFVYDENDIFAISKGYYGHHLLNEYTDIFFGMEVLSRLIDKSSTEIRQIEDRALFGSELGAQRYFRENYNLVYDDDFGKIYKAMLASINEEDFSKLGIVKKRETTKQVSISGSSSLEISTKFTYKELLARITNIKKLMMSPGVEFNQFYRVPVKELTFIKDGLNTEILKMAYAHYRDDENVDFYHPYIFEYLNATSTIFLNREIAMEQEIQGSASKKFKELIDEIGMDIIDTTTEDTFIKSLLNTGGSYKLGEEYGFINEVALKDWISGEVEYSGKKYFKVDNQWYTYRESLDQTITEKLADINFQSILPSFPLGDWNLELHPNEGAFNESFIQKPGFIVTDRTLMSNIEVSDLMRITNDEIQFYHVKKGLGQDMRVLSNQIINASRYLKSAIDEADSASLIKYFKAIKKKHYNDHTISGIDFQGNNIIYSQGDFIALLKSRKKISFVFVYATSSQESITNEITATNSRIAKLALLYTFRDMKRTDFEFKMQRINLLTP